MRSFSFTEIRNSCVALLSNAYTVYKADSGFDVFSPSSLTVMALSKIFFLLSFTLHSFLLPTAYASLSKRFQEHSVHEERSALPASWNKRSDTPLDKSRHIPVRINLVQNGIDEHGEDLLMKVSHPDSPHYGKHYTPHEIADLVGLSFFFFSHKNRSQRCCCIVCAKEGISGRRH